MGNGERRGDAEPDPGRAADPRVEQVLADAAALGALGGKVSGAGAGGAVAIAASQAHASAWVMPRWAASTCAAAAWPTGARSEISPVMERLSAYMSGAGARALPEAVALESKNHILDTLAAAISGSELPPGVQALKFAKTYGGSGPATIIASGMSAGPLEAAIVNGALAQADETDDNYSAGGAHPGCAVVPAALAMGEAVGADGKLFLHAVTLGYDIGMRAMKTILGRTVLRDMHNIVGTFGAAAAAGCLAQLNQQQMRWLIDYASQQAASGYGAWQRDTEHMEKAFVFGAMTARNGVTAAMVLQSGWTGVDDVFTGHENFFLTYAPKADPAGFIDKLGERLAYERTGTRLYERFLAKCAARPDEAAKLPMDVLRQIHAAPKRYALLGGARPRGSASWRACGTSSPHSRQCICTTRLKTRSRSRASCTPFSMLGMYLPGMAPPTTALGWP